MALEKVFELYPEVKIVVIAHLHGTPGKIDELKKVCDAHGALIVEDAVKSLGATYIIALKNLKYKRFAEG